MHINELEGSPTLRDHCYQAWDICIEWKRAHVLAKVRYSSWLVQVSHVLIHPSPLLYTILITLYLYQKHIYSLAKDDDAWWG